MKIKYFLRGLGIGILIATLLLFPVYAYQTSNRQIEKRAKEMGMEYPKEEKSDVFQETTEEASTEEISTEEESSAEMTSVQEETSQEKEVTSETTVQTEVKMSITKGMKAMDFAESMEELGMVEDGSDFRQYLIENGYASSLQVGDYVFQQGMSYEEIVAIVTK